MIKKESLSADGISVTKEVLESHLSKITASSAFTEMELDERRSYQEGIPKAHYKFFYESNIGTRDREGNVISNPKREILLDIIFEEDQYPELARKPVETEWLIQEGEPVQVVIPSIDSVTGDKLTAFAPNTTGVTLWCREGERDHEAIVRYRMFI